MADMQEVIGPLGFVIVGFGLSELIFVMWENQVDTARMNVHFLSKYRDCHGRALNVPAGSALTPGWWPLWLLGFSSFPKDKVFLVPLFILLIFFFLLSFGWIDSFELTIFKLFPVGLDIEVDGPIRGICVAIGDDFLDEGDNFRYILGNSGDVIGDFDAKGPE